MRRRGSLPLEGTSGQSTSAQKLPHVKKTDVKGKKRARQGSSEEEDVLPETLGSLIYQLGLTMVALKQHMGPGLNRYIVTHEIELKKIYDGLNALTELSAPLIQITQATQTDVIYREDDMEQMLSKELTDEELIELLPKRWPSALRTKLNLVTELPSEVGDTCSLSDVSRVHVIDDDESRRPKYKAGDILKDEQSVLGEQTEVRRSKYRIFYDSNMDDKNTMYIILKALRRISSNTTNLSYIVPNNNIGNYMKKIVSYLNREKEDTIKVLTLHTDRAATQVRPGQIRIKKATPPAEDSRTIVVKSEGKTYAELLGAMKTAVARDDVKDVISLKKGKNEEVLVRIQGSKRAAEFSSILKDKVADLKVDLKTRAGRRTTVHIRDVESDTTEEEILAAITARIGDTDEVKISSIRPGFAETKNVTVITSYKAACKMVEQRLRIGWVNCRAFIREEGEKCFRCWGTGHRRQDCKGPDRTNLCFNCGGKGHLIANCQEPKKCLTCNSQEHRTGAWQCIKNQNA